MAKTGHATRAYVAQKYAEDDASESKTEPPSDANNEPDLPFLDEDRRGSHFQLDSGGGPVSLRNVHNQRALVGELLSSSEDEASRGSIESYERASQQASDPIEAASTSEEIDVWENLKQIFADMDAQEGSNETKLLLKEPLARLRRLLHIHNDVSEKEKGLRRCHLGVLIERDWYSGKLREVEDTVESGPAKASTDPADIAFSGAVRSVLYKESPKFRLAGSKGRS